MGFEDLLIHPETILNDVPTRFGSYQPSNFRHRYHGQVSVREALQLSLNIPAVAVLNKIGPGRLAARLRAAGVKLHWHSEQTEPGLPLVLGGVGTSLLDLMTLYAGLANEGKVRPLRFQPDRKNAKEELALLDGTASWYLRDILSDLPPPSSDVPQANQRTPRRIAYKTGTSYGFRDAWALGYDDSYTVGVWVGRPDGSPHPGHYGRNTAAPLLFQVFDLLPRSNTLPTPKPSPGSVLLVSRDELPERLQYFQSGSSLDQRAARSSPLQITFPVHGSTVALSDSTAVLPLQAIGGAKPLRWLVNGRPLEQPSALTRNILWPADGAGLMQLTVIDSNGHTAYADVWLSYP